MSCDSQVDELASDQEDDEEDENEFAGLSAFLSDDDGYVKKRKKDKKVKRDEPSKTSSK